MKRWFLLIFAIISYNCVSIAKGPVQDDYEVFKRQYLNLVGGSSIRTLKGINDCNISVIIKANDNGHQTVLSQTDIADKTFLLLKNNLRELKIKDTQAYGSFEEYYKAGVAIDISRYYLKIVFSILHGKGESKTEYSYFLEYQLLSYENVVNIFDKNYKFLATEYMQNSRFRIGYQEDELKAAVFEDLEGMVMQIAKKWYADNE